jgi:hypothetical protein
MNILYPYIGVTDVISRKQAERLLKVFEAHLPNGSNYKFHVGVMTSYKVMNGLPTKFEKAFPKTRDIAGIFLPDGTYNCVHYIDYYGHGRPSFEDDLAEVISLGGENLHAVQLDMIWPDPESIGKVNGHLKDVEIILQIGEKAFDEVDEDPDELAERLDDYNGVVNRILLDRSMGTGKVMDAEWLLPFALAIRKRFPKMGLVAAGGLGSDTLQAVEPLLDEFPDLSIDAEGQLKKIKDTLEPLDTNLAEQYLIKAINLLC